MAQDEKTLPQRAAGVAVIQGGKLTKIVSVATYKTYRAMRKDPTICMARQLLMAPILASAWSIQEKEDAPEGARDFIDDQMSSVRLHLLGTAMRGCLDFGWQAYEKVFGVDGDGRIVIKKLKPLIQDFTDIMVDPETGAFAGLKQNLIDLEAPECLLLYIDAEGTDWYGQSVMENARGTYNMWNETNLGAERYDQKIAGSHWVIHYPEGPSLVDGKEVDNLEVAKDVITTLESSGAVVVPRRSGDTSDDFGRDQDDAWKIELISDGGPKQCSFVARLKYLDSLKVRAFGMPERAVLEGAFGTKAEAEVHANFAITNMELRHKLIVEMINWHLVNQLLRLNFGEGVDNSIFIEPAPITDMARTFLRDIYVAILKNPDGFAEEVLSIDLDGLKDQLSVPTVSELDAQLPARGASGESEEDEVSPLPLEKT